MTQKSWAKPILYGAAASSLLLAVYFIILTLVSGWEFALQQFTQFWYFIVALAIGFGVQVGLFLRLRHVTDHGDGSGKVVAVSGGTSTVAMISCCTHYLVNILPVLGATGVVALVAQFQAELFWVGLAFNAGGVAYVGSKLLQASRHMAQMEQGI